MTAQYEFEAFLRARLHAAAESLDPEADGLNRIRVRLTRSSPAVVLRARATWNEIFMRAPAALQDVCYWLAYNIQTAFVRFDRAITPGRHRSRAQSWLRPIAVMGVTLFIVAAGTYAVLTARNYVFPSTSGSQSSSGNATGSQPGGPAGPGASVSHSTSPPRGRRSNPAASCTPTAAATPAPAASPAASPEISPSPSPTPTDTSTTSLFPGPSPSDSTGSSPGPSDSPLPSGPPAVVPTTQPAAGPSAPAPCGRSS
jgi:hypothetical protein